MSEIHDNPDGQTQEAMAYMGSLQRQELHPATKVIFWGVTCTVLGRVGMDVLVSQNGTEADSLQAVGVAMVTDESWRLEGDKEVAKTVIVDWEEVHEGTVKNGRLTDYGEDVVAERLGRANRQENNGYKLGIAGFVVALWVQYDKWRDRRDMARRSTTDTHVIVRSLDDHPQDSPQSTATNGEVPDLEPPAEGNDSHPTAQVIQETGLFGRRKN